MIRTREYEWADVTVVMGGKVVVGLRGIEYGAKQEKELLHASGNAPHTIQRGNVSYEGKITLTQSEYEALRLSAQAQGKKSILDISFDVVVMYGNPTAGDVITTDKLIGCEFTEDKTAWKQGDKYQEKSLPILYLRQE